MDIAIHSFIQGVFLSHGFRKDVKFYFVFYGQPDPPKHIEIQVTDELEISKDIGNLIKKFFTNINREKELNQFKDALLRKSFLKVVEELAEKGCEIFIFR